MEAHFATAMQKHGSEQSGDLGVDHTVLARAMQPSTKSPAYPHQPFAKLSMPPCLMQYWLAPVLIGCSTGQLQVFKPGDILQAVVAQMHVACYACNP